MEIAMSAKDLDRTIVLRNVQEGLISKVEEASTLIIEKLNERHNIIIGKETCDSG